MFTYGLKLLIGGDSGAGMCRFLESCVSDARNPVRFPGHLRTDYEVFGSEISHVQESRTRTPQFEKEIKTFKAKTDFYEKFMRFRRTSRNSGHNSEF